MATGVPRARSRRGAEPPPALLHYAGREQAPARAEPPAFVRVRGPAAAPGRLFFADNLGVLAALATDPGVRGQVRVVYIDPPFATQSVFHARGGQEEAYADCLDGPRYLEFLRARLVLLRELLADDGSLYVHLDDKAVFYVKVLLDELFGPAMFRNCVVRTKCNPKNATRSAFGNVVDYILFYTKTPRYVWNRPHEPLKGKRAREYGNVEPGTGRRFMAVPLHAPGVRGGETGLPWRGKPPPPGKHWQYPPRVLDEMDARGEIYWSGRGNPRKKVYLDAHAGVPVQDLWTGLKDAHNQNVKITGYPTEKNPELVRRILEASSNPGDLVLDCFAGSGTTLAVAAATGRRWIGVDRSPLAIRATLGRLLSGAARMGDFVRPAAAEDRRGPAGAADFAVWADPALVPLLGEEFAGPDAPPPA